MINDLRLALRTISRNPGFALAAVLTLAIGIGANTAIFTVVNAALLRPLPVRDPARLVFIQEGTEQAPWQATSLPDLADYRQQNNVFEQIEGSTSADLNLKTNDRPERVLAAAVTPGYMTMIGIAPLIGRVFASDEEQPGRDRVVILSEGLWRAGFGADPHIVGRAIPINNAKYTVVGVMPQRCRFPFTLAEAWIPLTPDRAQLDRGRRFLEITGRLRPGVNVAQAQAQMGAILSRLASEYPATNAGRRIVIRTLQDQRTRNVRVEFSILLGAVMFVFLMGCANVANLLLARAASRTREVAIRRALGAGRWRLLRQFLLESLVLAAAGTIFASLLAVWGVDLLVSLPGMPIVDDLAPDAAVLGFAVALYITATVVMAFAGALQSSRVRVNDALKESSRTATGTSASARLRRVLVTGEVALAVVLLVGAGLLIESFWKLYRTDPGFNPRHVLAMRVSLPVAQFGAALDQIASLPGVVTASSASGLPLEHQAPQANFEIDGRPAARKQEEPFAVVRAVSPAYFRTLEIPLLSGRAFQPGDDAGHPKVAIVNQRLATLYFPGTNPIGQRLRTTGSQWMVVVGIAGDIYENSVGREPLPEIAVPYTQLPQTAAPLTLSLAVRTKGDPAALAAQVRKRIANVDAAQPVFQVRTMQRVVWDSMGGDRSGAELMGTFGALAALLAAVGIYGVVSYLVRQRRQEIGVRIALGASMAGILRMVALQAFRLTAAGVALGLAGAAALTRVMAGHIYVSVTDPVVFSVVPAFLALVALLATIVPALSASRVDPIEALRYE